VTLKSISHYQITGTLGKGGMGIVYKAIDQKLKRIVAIKTLPPEKQSDEKLKKRLMSEALAASSLNHPNICTIYEVDEVDDTILIAMEYIEGHALSEEISNGPIELEKGLDIAIQAAGAFDKAHRSDIIHRDIKPSNIAITKEGNVKILDFGLARLIRRLDKEAVTDMLTQDDSHLTETGKVAGTLAYMSPEQLKAEEIDGQSDIFSFGVVLYEMFSGQRPFNDGSMAQMIRSIIDDHPEPLRKMNTNLPADLDRVIAKALAKKRADRYKTMKDLLDDLTRLRNSPSKPVVKVDQKSVAVLYFENLGNPNEQEYLRDGMTEDVITELSKVGKLRVYPRSAVIAYRDKPANTDEIGRTLNAAYVLAGSIRKSGNRVRVTAQLIESESNHTIWAERYDREMNDVFDLQDELARAIANALSIKISPEEEKAIFEKETRDPKAYDYYLQGRRLFRRGTKKDMLSALEMFNQAIILDPNFALAYAGIGHVCGRIHRYYDQNPDWMKKGMDACERAMKIEPNLAEALSARAFLFYSHEQYEEAIRDAKTAIQGRQDCEGAYFALALALNVTDRLDEASRIADQALEFNGEDYNVYVPFLNIFWRLGEHEKLKRLRQQQVHVLKMHLEWSPENVRARVLLAGVLLNLGRQEEGSAELHNVLSANPDDAATLYNAACGFAILGRKKEALDTLKKAIENGFWHIDVISRDQDFNNIRDDPEFQLILQRANSSSIPREPEAQDIAPSPRNKRNRQFALITIIVVLLTVLAVYYLIRRTKTDTPKVTPQSTSRTAIVVLPFKDLSANKDQEYFSDGLTEELLNVLARNPQLRVTSRTSAFSFKDRNVEIKTIAQKLNVTHVLEGSVRKSGNQLRITAQLIEVATDSHLWSENYDRQLENIFAVQEDIAASVADALKLTLQGSEIPMVSPTKPEAYNAYLQGRFFFDRRSEADLKKAISYLEQSLQIDPKYAPAWTALSAVYSRQADWSFIPLHEGYRKALKASEKALELDPNLAESHAQMGWIKRNYSWDWDGADLSYKRALDLEPQNAVVLRGVALQAATLGRTEEAIRLAQKAIELDPLRPQAYFNLAIHLNYSGRLPEAEAQLRKVLEINPQQPMTHLFLGRVLLAQSKVKEAIEEIQQETDPFWKTYGFAIVYHAAGKKKEANAALSEIIQKNAHDSAQQIAEVYAFRGENDKAFEWLDRAYKQHDGGLSEIKYRDI
jgi:non-specific serine/threonine protein kinase